MSRHSTHTGGLSWRTALAVLTVCATGAVATLGIVDATAPARATASGTDPQDGPADDFGGYLGLAEPGAAADATTNDEAGDTKAEPLGPVGERTSVVPDVSGEPVVEGPDSAAALVPDASEAGDTAARLRAAVDADGAARVIVTMRQQVELEAELTRRQVGQQRSAIDARLKSLDRSLVGTSRVVREFTVVPAAVAMVDEAGLEALLADPRVAALTLDREAPLALDVSTGVIDSDLLNSAGVLGNNFEGSSVGAYEVAVLDSGVDNQHNAFAGRIVAQACFSAT